MNEEADNSLLKYILDNKLGNFSTDKIHIINFVPWSHLTMTFENYKKIPEELKKGLSEGFVIDIEGKDISMFFNGKIFCVL